MDTGNHRGARQGCSRHAGGQRGTQGSSIGGTNSLSRESNTERTNKALSGIKLISSWIGKVWKCLGGCGRPLWLELEHPQKIRLTSGQQWKTRICPGRSSLLFPGTCRWSYSPLCLLFHHQLSQISLEEETKMLPTQRIPAQDT